MKIFIDIETIPGSTYPTLEDVKVPSNYKDPAKIKAYREDHLEETYQEQALNSLQGKILCIGGAVDNEDPIAFIDKEGESDELILRQFEDFIKQFGFKTYEYVGWNLRTFDLTWIWRNAVKYGMERLRTEFLDKGKRSPFIIDLMEVWQANFRDYVSLSKTADFLGLGKKEIDGSMVYGMWKAKKHDDIANYCKSDIILTREVYIKTFGGLK